jgi:hypothetical protein
MAKMKTRMIAAAIKQRPNPPEATGQTLSDFSTVLPEEDGKAPKFGA